MALVALTACGNSEQAKSEMAAGPDPSSPMNNEPPAANGTAATDLQKPGPGNALAQGDGEALGLLSAINHHEIDAARQAQARKLPAAVNDFAAMMIKDHTANEEALSALGSPAETDAVKAQKAKGETDLKALGDHKNDYAKAYVDAMVKGHTEALKTIDDKLLPEAQSQDVKQHLEKTRATVSQHLDAAKALR